jgi:acyl-lipid omega-6 desaturase (Delta-12 desaturase)
VSKDVNVAVRRNWRCQACVRSRASSEIGRICALDMIERWPNQPRLFLTSYQWTPTLQDARQAIPTAIAGEWTRILAKYREPSQTRSLVELITTAGAFAASWLLIWAALGLGYWLSLFLSVPAAGFLVRLFMIQHDCGHGAFFRRRAANDWVGRAIGVLTLTPYDIWRRSHAIHHASSGNLERRGIGDINTLTVREYLGLSRWRRLGYRLYRNPIVMFGLGPAYLFILQHRFPIGAIRGGLLPWLSTMATNGAIALTVVGMMCLVGVEPFLLVHLPVTLLAASIGVWLFYVQHQFENTYWARAPVWTVQEAALYGSSYYDLPHILRWFTANIGVHHVHHLSSRIPYYRLPRVLRDHPELRAVGRLTLLKSLACVRLVLWDERRGRLISFRELRKERPAPNGV